MLVDKLRHAISAQQHTEIVKPGDDSLQFDAVHQKHGNWNFLLPHMVEESILEVLLFFLGHCSSLAVVPVSNIAQFPQKQNYGQAA